MIISYALLGLEMNGFNKKNVPYGNIDLERSFFIILQDSLDTNLLKFEFLMDSLHR